MHVCNHAVTYATNARMGQNTSKTKTTTIYLLCTHMHLTVPLKDMAPQRSCKETKEKPQERQGVDWTSWVFIITEL